MKYLTVQRATILIFILSLLGVVFRSIAIIFLGLIIIVNLLMEAKFHKERMNKK